MCWFEQLLCCKSRQKQLCRTLYLKMDEKIQLLRDYLDVCKIAATTYSLILFQVVLVKDQWELHLQWLK